MQLASDISSIAQTNNFTGLPALTGDVGNQTTALRPWTTLTAADGIYYNASLNIMVVTKSGATFDGIDFRGTTLQIRADDVTIKNSSFDASVGPVSINEFAGYSNLAVDHCTFDGLKLDSTYADFITSRGINTSITNSAFLNAPGDAMYIENGKVAGNYIAGGGYMTGAHSDGIWVGKTTGSVLITDNVIDWRTPSDAKVATNNAIRIVDELGSVSDVTVSHNIILGGSYSVLVQDQTSSPSNIINTVSNITVTDNIVDYGMYGPLYPGGRPATLIYSDNINATGAAKAFDAQTVTATPLDMTGLKDIVGTAGADTMNGTAVADHVVGGAGNDWISAKGGDDVIEGGAGRDYIYGGDGANTFLYRQLTDSTPTSADLICDFKQGIDKIDLSALDGAPDPSHWSWLGSANFSGTAWQVRTTIANNHTFLEIDTNGDLSADFKIEFSTAFDLKQSDLILERVAPPPVVVNPTPVVDPLPVESPPAVPQPLFLIPDNVIQGTTGADILKGTAGADYLIGGAGNDSISGGNGDDVIYGGQGKDILTGGAGHDVFVFKDVADSPAGGTMRDYITDFTTSDDKIDLSSIDANPLTTDHDSFNWIGLGNFTGHAGELRYSIINNTSTQIQADFNGDGKADFEIDLAGVKSLTADNFTKVLLQDPTTVTTQASAQTPVQVQPAVYEGTDGNNTLVGTSAPATFNGHAGDDVIRGGSGNDIIIGGLGKDILYGGGGNNVFIYQSLADSTAQTAGRDFIGDFKEGQDKIDLSRIDANTLTSAKESFAFVGTDAFSGHAGELRYEARNGNTFVFADANGDKVADFQIDLAGIHTLHQSDFIV